MEARGCNEIERKGDSQFLWRHDGVSRTLTTRLLGATTGGPARGPMRRRLGWTFVGLCERLPRVDVAKPWHLYWNKGFILVHLERRLHSTNRSHLNGRGIHVVRVLLV